MDLLYKHVNIKHVYINKFVGMAITIWAHGLYSYVKFYYN